MKSRWCVSKVIGTNRVYWNETTETWVSDSNLATVRSDSISASKIEVPFNDLYDSSLKVIKL